ncbi:MAG: OmpA family protein [Bradyrhizobiaceae bacterium]|nr:OmpA family protein [Bradyrhizobiaceae bacterium]
MNRILSLTLLFVLAAGQVFADTTDVTGSLVPGSRIGFYGAAAFNMSSPNVQVWQLPANSTPFLGRYASDSLRFSDGSTGFSLVGGVAAMFPINRMWHVGGRLGINWLNASSSLSQGVTSDTTIRHDFSASVIALELMPTVEVHDLFSIPVYLLGGLEVGVPLSSSRDQTSYLDVNNANVLQENTTGATSIPATSTRIALALGAGYTMELGKDVWLQPEVSYRLPLTSVSSDADHSPWKIGQLRIGVNLLFGIGGDAPKPEPDAKKATARLDPTTALDGSGREYEVQSLNIEDVTYTEMFPLVPYIFYPVSKATPDASMQSTESRNEKGGFVPEKLELDALEVNRNLLNIVGARMQKIPHSTLTITGTTDGVSENGKGALASQRAQWAKDYLVNSFAIADSRIALRTTPTPEKASSTTDPDGVVENRRAELASNVPDVLEPLVITADNQRIATPNVVMFHPVVEGADSVDKWVMSVTQAGRPLRELSGTGQPKNITWSIKPNELSGSQVPVDFSFTATTSNGQTVEANGSLPVDYVSSVQKRTERLADRTIDKYSLILFDFDKATLTDDNKRILERTVLPSIKANSKVSIIGYTDRIGAEEHNKKLSMERSQTVMEFLRSRATDAAYTATGVGEGSEIYSNNSPTGRQLSRTVQVIVETVK